MGFVNLDKIVVIGSEESKELDRLKQVNKKREEEHKSVSSAVKDNKIAKQKEKIETDELMDVIREKKHKSIKKIVSMSNNEKSREDIQKKIGRLLDKYYVKYEELPY